MADKSGLVRIARQAEPAHGARHEDLSSRAGPIDVRQAAGNLAVQRLLRGGVVQANLEVSQPGDADEQEADRIADRIMCIEDPGPMPSSFGVIHRKRAACEAGDAPSPSCEEEEKIQRKESASTTSKPGPSLHAQIAGLRGSGEPLSLSARAFFEPRFGRDLGQVRVHTGGEAAGSAYTIRARAYTAGNNIVFGERQYSPNSVDGKKLLAHELTHVVQQGAAHAVGNGKGPVSLPQRTDASQGTTRIQRYVTGDIRTMSINPEFAQALTDEELDEQMTIVRRQLTELSPGAPEYETARGNLDILNREQANRPWAIPGGGALQLPGAESAATALFTGPVIRIPSEVNYILLNSPAEAGPSAPVLASETSGFGWGPALAGSTAIGGARGLGYVISPPLRGPIDPFLPLLSRLNAGRGPLGPLETGGYGLERYVSQNILRDMRPRYATEVADLFMQERMGSSPWILAAGRTERELSRIPGLVRQMAEGGLEALAPADRVLLTDFFRAHAEAGTTFASPAMSSTMQPGLSSMEGVAPFLQERPYVVRVELPSTTVGEVNAVLGPGRRAALASELEVLITTDARGNITSIRPNPTSALGRAAPALRWGGRALIVVGVAVSTYRISTATTEERPRVIGEEAGLWAGGYGGAALAAAGCVALGIASGGFVLFLCGLGGGIIGGFGGSALGGEIGEAVGPRPLERVGSWAVNAYTDSMLRSDNPTVRQDAVAIRRAAFDDDAMSWMYLMSRMAGY